MKTKEEIIKEIIKKTFVEGSDSGNKYVYDQLIISNVPEMMEEYSEIKLQEAKEETKSIYCDCENPRIHNMYANPICGVCNRGVSKIKEEKKYTRKQMNNIATAYWHYLSTDDEATLI